MKTSVVGLVAIGERLWGRRRVKDRSCCTAQVFYLIQDLAKGCGTHRSDAQWSKDKTIPAPKIALQRLNFSLGRSVLESLWSESHERCRAVVSRSRLPAHHEHLRPRADCAVAWPGLPRLGHQRQALS